MPEPPERIFERATPAQLTERLGMIQERVRLGVMPPPAFDEALKLFQFTDDVGHLWAPGVASGRWYRWDRTQWTPADPPAALNVPNLLMTLTPSLSAPAAQGASPGDAPATAASGATAAPQAKGRTSRSRRGQGDAAPASASGVIAAPSIETQQPARPQQSPSPAGTETSGATGVFCSRCGTRSAPGAKFCPGCGAPLGPSATPAGCPQCGTPTQPGQRFCRGCGAALPGAVAGGSGVAIPARPVPPAQPYQPPVPQAARGAPAGTSFTKRTLKVVVPVAALIATYYTQAFVMRTFGPALIAQFGDVVRQVVPAVVIMVIGGIAYKLVR